MLIVLKNHHKIVMSIRTLHGKLKMYGLPKKSHCTEDNPWSIIEDEVTRSSSYLGYSGTWNLLRSKYGISSSRDLVMSLKTLKDQTNRKYLVKRVNRIWHTDGLGKRKPHGFPIYTATDDFSHKALWIKAHSSNNNPIIPVCYFIEILTSLSWL